jgi:CRP/FNR family transcriptional regulator, anaerobic regulatory protein
MSVASIKDAIDPIVRLTSDEWKYLSEFLELKLYPKNSCFLKEGQTCCSVAFVQKGTLIYFRLLESGKELTTDFAFSGDWVTDNRSRISQLPSHLNIKTIDDTELLVISNQNLETCFEKIPKLEKLGRRLIETAFVKITQQSIDLQTLHASQRYEKMLNEYPEIFQKIPLHHIANYLGIAPKSLSRIRKG